MLLTTYKICPSFCKWVQRVQKTEYCTALPAGLEMPGTEAIFQWEAVAGMTVPLAMQALMRQRISIVFIGVAYAHTGLLILFCMCRQARWKPEQILLQGINVL